MKNVLRMVWSYGLLKNETNFKESAKEVWNINIDFLCYFDLYYHNWFKYIKTWEEFNKYDIYWIWWAEWKYMCKWLLYQLWKLENNILVDSRRKYNLTPDKFSQILFLKHYWFNIPNTLFFVIHKKYKEYYIKILEKELKYPFIVKIPDVNRWEWVFIVKNREDLLDIINSKNSKRWLLFQEKIENEWDYRIITIWNKVIWWIKRYNPNDYRNNVSKWWFVEKYDVPEYIKKIAIDITSKFDNCISGIDFFINDNWDYSVIEINNSPQYEWFEKATWLSYTKEVLKYLKGI